MPRWTSLVLLLAVFVTAGFPAHAAAQPTRTIGGAPTCAPCRIELAGAATLSLPSDSLSFGIGLRVTQHGSGYVAIGLNETRVPALFDSSGRFVRLIGRTGAGPGELDGVTLVASADDSTLWVMNGAERQVFRSDGTWVRKDVLPLHPSDLIVLDGGSSIATGQIPQPGVQGQPLHLITPGGSVAASFGLTEPERSDLLASFSFGGMGSRMHRLLAPGDAGELWAFNNRQFAVEKYSIAGSLLLRLEHATDGWLASASMQRPDGAGPPYLGIAELSEDSGVLWLVYYAPRAPGGSSLSGLNDWLDMYDLVVEAVNLADFSVLAVQRFERAMAYPIQGARGSIAMVLPVDDVFAQIRISKPTLMRDGME